MTRPIPFGRLRALARAAAGITPNPAKAAWAAAFRSGVEEHRRQQFILKSETDAPRGLAGGYRQPGDLVEFCQMLPEHGWDWTLGSFLDHFRALPNRASLNIPPGPDLQGYQLAFMAATVEIISKERGWAAPAWTEEASTFLPSPTCEEAEMFDDEEREAYLQLVEAKTPAEFRRRNILVGNNCLTRF
jgi:hypothetical protein